MIDDSPDDDPGQPDKQTPRPGDKTVADQEGTVSENDPSSSQQEARPHRELPPTEFDDNPTIDRDPNSDRIPALEQDSERSSKSDRVYESSAESSDTSKPKASKTVDSSGDALVDSSNDSAAQDDGTAMPSTPSVTTPELNLRARVTNLPDHIGRYKTVSRLGEGSFGVVVKAFDPQLDRDVAVKLQKVSPLMSKRGLQRFQNEAKAAASLRHPNIVPVYELGDFGGNQFIVYEYIRGRTLEEWLEEEKPSVEAKVKMIAQIADALDYAHSLKIIHRDIKPANILISYELDVPHIADFGCAKLELDDTTQTVDGTMLGTPPYMSPEVIEGFASRADARSDLWSVGVMLYETLVGERPFRGSRNELRHKISRLAPKRLRHHNAEIPIDLETITLKCLEKEADRRYQTCGQLAKDLNNWLRGEPITARPVGPLQKTWMWAKRNPTTASLVGMIAACLIVLAISSIAYSIHMKSQRDELVQRRIVALYSASPELLPDLIEDLNDLDPKQAILQLEKIREQPNRTRRQAFVDALTASAFDENAENSQELLNRTLEAEPAEVLTALTVCRSALQSNTKRLEQIATQDTPESGSRAHAVANCLLANLVPDDAIWQERSQNQNNPMIDFLLSARAEELPEWCRLLKPINESMSAAWQQRFRSSNTSVANRAAEVVSELYDGDFVFELAIDAKPSQLARMRNAFVRNPAINDSMPLNGPMQEANFWLVRALQDKPEPWRSSVIGDDYVLVRSYLIRDCAAAGLSANSFIDRLKERLKNTDEALTMANEANRLAFAIESGDELSAYILALGQFNQQQLYESQRSELVQTIFRYLNQHRSVAVHSACRWLLHHWGFEEQANDYIQSMMQTNLPRDGFQWHEDVTGICYAVFEPTTFQAGTPEGYDGPKHPESVKGRQRQLPHRFGISIYETRQDQVLNWESELLASWKTLKESSIEQGDQEMADKWQARITNYKNRQLNRRIPADPLAPMSDITWHAIALYCNGLNRKASLDASADVYSINFGRRSFQASTQKSSIDRKGHRLPSQYEWEYAARANTNWRFFFGDDLKMLDSYGWSVGNSAGRLQPVGQLMPNPFGMFDVHGNAAEWCHDSMEGEDGEGVARWVRDQSALEEASDMTVFWAERSQPAIGKLTRGFRVARSYETPKNPEIND